MRHILSYPECAKIAATDFRSNLRQARLSISGGAFPIPLAKSPSCDQGKNGTGFWNLCLASTSVNSGIGGAGGKFGNSPSEDF